MWNRLAHLRRWVFVAGVFAAADSGFAQKYSVVDLGEFTNSLSTVNAINNLGQFAGVLNIDGGYRAGLYGGSWTNLGTLGGTSSFALGMNDALRVVGRSRLTDGTVNRAFLWTPSGTDGIASNPQMKDLGTLGGAAAEADDINQSGQITGYAQTGSADHAYRYSGGTMTDIGSLLPNKHNSYGYGINDAGHVVGTDYDNAFNQSSAFLYDGSTATVLTFSGWNNTHGLAINNNTNIIGYVSDSASTINHAFRYSGSFVDLETLGGHFSYALSINNSNTIVGASYTDANDTIYHAFICTNNSMSDLNNQIDASGAGWVLNEARAINDGGQIIGIGTLNGVKHAYLLATLSPRITNQPASQTVAAGTSATFTVGATGSMPLGYQWRFNETPIVGATASSYTVTNAQTNNAGDYSVAVTNNYGAITSSAATLTVTVWVPPQITNIKVVGTNVLLSFTTMNKGVYFIESKSNLVTEAWSDLISSIVGNGSVNTTTNFGGAASLERYYRVRLSSP